MLSSKRNIGIVHFQNFLSTHEQKCENNCGSWNRYVKWISHSTEYHVNQILSKRVINNRLGSGKNMC